MSVEETAVPVAEAVVAPPEPPFLNAADSGVEPAAKAEHEAEPAKEEPAAEPKAEGEEDAKAKQTPWFQKRIDALTQEGREAQRQLDAARAELARIRTAPPAEGEAAPKPPAPSEADIDRLATEKAQRIAATREFDAACNGVYEAGSKAYADFDAALGSFKMLGGMPPTLVEAAIETDNPARVLYELGKNPEEAQRVMALPPIKMAAAVARLAAKPPTTPPISKAPAPIKPINGAGRVEVDDSKLSMAEWEKKNPLPSRH